MKVTELRIGNLINLYDDFNSQITGFTETGNVWFVKNPEYNECSWHVSRLKPIELTEEQLIRFGYEDWGVVISNEYESYKRFVLHNFLGASNHEVHIITSTYGNTNYIEYVTSIDNDERQYSGRMEFVHDLQNAVYKETGIELELCNHSKK